MSAIDFSSVVSRIAGYASKRSAVLWHLGESGCEHAVSAIKSFDRGQSGCSISARTVKNLLGWIVPTWCTAFCLEIDGIGRKGVSLTPRRQARDGDRTGTSSLVSWSSFPKPASHLSYAERFVRSIKESFLDQMIFFGEDALRNSNALPQ